MRRWLAFALVGAALAAAPAGWLASDELESHDEFCVSCHLSPELPLHRDKLRDFSSFPAQSLVAAHAEARREFRCIDCHGGTGALGRLRVKLVAARDAARYALGTFQEPEHMRHPLWVEDCARCHASYRPARDDAFHALDVHNVELPWGCVDCHRSHTADAPAELHFLSREVVLPVCRNCHEEF